MKTLEHFDFGSQRGGRTRYDWDAILDGDIHVLSPGTEAEVEAGEADFSCKPQTIRMRCRTQAKKLGLRVRTAIKGKDVIVQAYDSDAFDDVVSGDEDEEAEVKPKKKAPANQTRRRRKAS